MWGAIKEWTRTVSREAGSGETRPSQLFADTAGLWCSGPSRVTTDEHDAEYSVMHCITEEKTVTLTHTHTHTQARARAAEPTVHLNICQPCYCKHHT